MNKSELKDRLKEAMDIRGLKQADIVEKGKIDKGQLSSWLSGKYKPRQNNISKLSEILSVDEAWLMGYDVPMERSTPKEFQHGAEQYNNTHKQYMLSQNESTLISECLAFQREIFAVRAGCQPGRLMGRYSPYLDLYSDQFID